MVCFLAIEIALVTTTSVEYNEFGWAIAFARANGRCINFTSMMALILVLRRSITFLRTLGFAEYLPLDHHIYYHKVAAWFLIFHSLLHTIGHIFNFRYVSRVTGVPLGTLLTSSKLGIGWIGGIASISGWVLLAILIAMLITSAPYMRQSGKFEVCFLKT